MTTQSQLTIQQWAAEYPHPTSRAGVFCLNMSSKTVFVFVSCFAQLTIIFPDIIVYICVLLVV